MRSSAWLVAAGVCLLSVEAWAQTWGQPAPAPAPSPGAGGLVPPPAPEATEPATTQQLVLAEQDDSGRGLSFFWVAPTVGFRGVHLVDDSIFEGTTVPKDSVGLAIGGAAGVRLLYFTGGVDFRYGLLSEWDAWLLNLQFGIRIPLGNLEPYVDLGGGFTSIVVSGSESTVTPEVLGGNVRIGGGVDYFVTDVFSVGARLSAELWILSRGGVAGQAPGSFYGGGATGVGLSYEPAVVLGIHL